MIKIACNLDENHLALNKTAQYFNEIFKSLSTIGSNKESIIIHIGIIAMSSEFAEFFKPRDPIFISNNIELEFDFAEKFSQLKNNPDSLRVEMARKIEECLNEVYNFDLNRVQVAYVEYIQKFLTYYVTDEK